MLQAPFPWFGGKSKVSDLIWAYFGTGCKNYVEPFYGSGAVWLNKPSGYTGCATLNDIDGNITNVWRAIQADPTEVAKHCTTVVNECDLHARHLWLVNNLSKLSGRLMADPDYYDARAAGWWIWGCCSWIGSGWCSGKGPWGAELDGDGILTLVKQNKGQGVNKQIPHLGNKGRGVNKKLPHATTREEWLIEWFHELQTALSTARIACGDWERVCTASVMTLFGDCAVFLDPPYSLTNAVYAHDSSTISQDVRRWCTQHGENPKLKIVLCGHEGEGHEELESLGWSKVAWRSKGGYQGSDDRERLWVSPYCEKPHVVEIAGKSKRR